MKRVTRHTVMGGSGREESEGTGKGILLDSKYSIGATKVDGDRVKWMTWLFIFMRCLAVWEILDLLWSPLAYVDLSGRSTVRLLFTFQRFASSMIDLALCFLYPCSH